MNMNENNQLEKILTQLEKLNDRVITMIERSDNQNIRMNDLQETMEVMKNQTDLKIEDIKYRLTKNENNYKNIFKFSIIVFPAIVYFILKINHIY